MSEREAVVATDQERKCRECGCTELAACVDEFDVACHWVEWDLCSMCSSAPKVYRYCGDPACWVCLERGLAPLPEEEAAS